jgi:hypothetical protein
MLGVDGVSEGEFCSSRRRRFKKEDWSMGGRAKSTGKLGISHPSPGRICERALLIFTSWTSRRSTLGWIKTAVKSTAKNNSTIFASVFERFAGFSPISRRAPRLSLRDNILYLPTAGQARNTASGGQTPVFWGIDLHDSNVIRRPKDDFEPAGYSAYYHDLPSTGDTHASR